MVVIVISALAALIVILLIIYFACKRGCVCCDNLCCKGRCHKSEREQKATEESNKQLQQQLQMMNTQMRTMQAVQMQQVMGSNQALAMTHQPMPSNFHKNPPNPNQLSIGYNQPDHAQVSRFTPAPSPHVNRRNDNRQQRDIRKMDRAPSKFYYLLIVFIWHHSPNRNAQTVTIIILTSFRLRTVSAGQCRPHRYSSPCLMSLSKYSIKMC